MSGNGEPGLEFNDTIELTSPYIKYIQDLNERFLITQALLAPLIPQH